jgi:hypothetical protein
MMHVVLGDGEMTRRELSKTLEDLLEKADENEDFWFLVQGKAEPTATDTGLMAWITERKIYFQAITDDKKNMAPIYKEAQETYEVKRLAPKVLSLMQELPAENEEAALFGLFVNNDADVEEDTWLNDVTASVAKGGFKIFAMNDGLAELELPGAAAEEQPEEEQPDNVTDITPKSRKAPKQAPTSTEDEVEEKTADESIFTRDDLENFDSDKLREIGAARGLDFPPRTRMTTMVKAILGEGPAVEAEVAAAVEVPEEEAETTYVSDVIVTSDALLVVVFNGTVVSRTITADEARDLIAR